MVIATVACISCVGSVVEQGGLCLPNVAKSRMPKDKGNQNIGLHVG